MRASAARDLGAWICGAMVVTIAATAACSRTEGAESPISARAEVPGRQEPSSPSRDTPREKSTVADVLEVRATGRSEAYTFAVTLRSPDTGCDQYADWWEVLTPDGKLVYRRILMHSHANEQPFTRSGGPVKVDDTTELVVRAHLSNAGYGGVAFVGSVASGFAADSSISAALAPELGDVPPQPTRCAF